MVFIEIIKAIILSILRKRAYRSLIVSFAAPIVLATILLSIPNISRFADTMLQGTVINTTNLFVAQDAHVTSDLCSSVEVAGVVRLNEFELPLIIASVDILLKNIVNFKEVAKDCGFVSVPMDIYRRYLDGGIAIDDVKRCVSHTHTGFYAVIVLVNNSIDSRVKLCRINSLEVLRYAFKFLEKGVVEASLAWITALLIAHAPLMYIALSRVFTALEDEIEVFLYLGIDRRKIILGVAIAITSISSIILMFLISISIVALNTLHKVANLYWFSLQPSPRLLILPIALIVLCLTIAISLALGLRRIEYG
uniref:ABC transporter permease n=1 Tax=Ignisphaera aggregans TaxID=334771 RepID=A0A7J3I8D2_9CREN